MKLGPRHALGVSDVPLLNVKLYGHLTSPVNIVVT